jgi:hypothetical protein
VGLFPSDSLVLKCDIRFHDFAKIYLGKMVTKKQRHNFIFIRIRHLLYKPICQKEKYTYIKKTAPGSLFFHVLGISSDRIERFIEGQAFLIERLIEDQSFLWSYDLAPRPPPPPSHVGNLDRRHTGRLRKRGSLLTGKGGSGGGRLWSRIIRAQEGLVLYKSFNPRCISLT